MFDPPIACTNCNKPFVGLHYKKKDELLKEYTRICCRKCLASIPKELSLTKYLVEEFIEDLD